jgi:hypothetical protein
MMVCEVCERKLGCPGWYLREVLGWSELGVGWVGRMCWGSDQRGGASYLLGSLPVLPDGFEWLVVDRPTWRAIYRHFPNGAGVVLDGLGVYLVAARLSEGSF